MIKYQSLLSVSNIEKMFNEEWIKHLSLAMNNINLKNDN
jgi:truncated hemoglobin YjbI